MTELLDQGAGALAAAVQTGKTSARDVAEAAITRVEARSRALTAIVDFDPAEARAAADAVDSWRKQGFDGPLLGVPVGLQIGAPRLHDRPLLATAQRAETALG